MYLLRDAQKSDLKGLGALAAVLNSVNLPNDERALAEIVELSCRSFQGRIREPLQRAYVFVLEEPRTGRVAGTSMLIAQHGTRESPCTFFNVSTREHYSSTLDRHFEHQVLSIGYHFDGPTEIGGLVVHPADRARPDQAGKQLSLVRFLYLAMFPERFRDTVLAELMPPLAPGGKSPFWESCGKRFTGLEYQEADKRSRENKEFIQQLFPSGDLYATLLPPRVQRLLGAVGPATEPARRMLEAIGFRRVSRIDPFDGGPHYEARRDEILPVRAYRRGRVATAPLRPSADDRPKLVGLVRPDGKVRFRAVRAPARFEGDDVLLPPEARERLEVEPGERVGVIPLD
ncbi:MAG TPA: arginine N-succinyltransferase [Anaeromyxobacteraceae bacterium]|jgi:arginine N-succinyltransferase|nr:arginine N-succinyltransferase [Anaeromyxobacteraceae bacterium]